MDERFEHFFFSKFSYLKMDRFEPKNKSFIISISLSIGKKIQIFYF